MSKMAKQGQYYLVDHVNLPATAMLELEEGLTLDVEVNIVDKRHISDSQRKLIFAICKDVENFTGNDSELVRYTAMEHCGIKSLTSCSVVQANKIITELIDFCIMNEIPFSKDTINSEDFTFEEKHIYMLILTKRCCICGRNAEIHHVDAIGMGNNRNKVSHVGKRILPLCRKHHNIAHQMGDNAFIHCFKLKVVKVDKRIEKFIKKGIIDMEE